MNETGTEPTRVLVTGGTSGLGLRLVKVFLNQGFEVTATGRKPVTLFENAERFTFLAVDFSNLKNTVDAVKELCRNSRFDIVVNNAGVLSPPDLMLTNDGFEYTFQVNFLSHLIMDEIILSKAKTGQSITIVTITSLVYRIANPDLNIRISESDYRPLKAYANSKLYLALMVLWLPQKYPSLNLRCIAFDPGIFSSGIYRMQKKYFRIMYRIGSPFMSRPEKTARRIGKLLESDDLTSGMIYRSSTRKKRIFEADKIQDKTFWEDCYRMIGPFLAW